MIDFYSQNAVSDEMKTAIRLWQSMYENKSPWLTKNVHSLNLAAIISAELSRLATIELKSVISGSERADFLNKPYAHFLRNIRQYVEYGCAKGGVMFKPYVTPEGIQIEAIHNGRFVPIKFDSSGNITGAVFSEQIVHNGKLFTRLESHELNADEYIIKNSAYEEKSGITLGRSIEISDVPEWSHLDPAIVIKNVSKPLFAYFKMPFANNIDDFSPLGVSVFSRCTELIRDADEQYSRLLWEFEGSELAVDASSDLLRLSADRAEMPKLNERLFRKLETTNPDFFSVFNPNIRDESLINGLNAILRCIEFACGLAYGTISDVRAIQRTAQEIIESKQRSYSVAKDIQKSLENALSSLIDALDVLADLYHLAPKGKILKTFEWGDSFVTDKATSFEERMKMVETGVLRPERLLSWYFGCPEEEAQKMRP